MILSLLGEWNKNSKAYRVQSTEYRDENEERAGKPGFKYLETLYSVRPQRLCTNYPSADIFPRRIFCAGIPAPANRCTVIRGGSRSLSPRRNSMNSASYLISGRSKRS